MTYNDHELTVAARWLRRYQQQQAATERRLISRYLNCPILNS